MIIRKRKGFIVKAVRYPKHSSHCKIVDFLVVSGNGQPIGLAYDKISSRAPMLIKFGSDEIQYLRFKEKIAECRVDSLVYKSLAATLSEHSLSLVPKELYMDVAELYLDFHNG